MTTISPILRPLPLPNGYQLSQRHLPKPVIGFLNLHVPYWQVAERTKHSNRPLPHGIYVIHNEDRLTILVAIQRKSISNFGKRIQSYSVSSFSYKDQVPLDHVFVSGDHVDEEARLNSSFYRLKQQIDCWNQDTYNVPLDEES